METLKYSEFIDIYHQELDFATASKLISFICWEELSYTTIWNDMIKIDGK